MSTHLEKTWIHTVKYFDCGRIKTDHFGDQEGEWQTFSGEGTDPTPGRATCLLISLVVY